MLRKETQQERFYLRVGAFVVIAFVLLLIGAVFFYEEYKHSRVQTFVMFFKGSLRGLAVGSSATYRGVKIGEVQAIEITENKAKDKVRIPVYVQFFVEQSFGVIQNPIHLLIRNGYVANISKPNFLSGAAEIELIQSSSRRKFKQTYYHNYPIFPSENTLEKYTTMDEALKAAKKTFEEISHLASSKEVQETLRSVQRLAQGFERLALDLNQSLPSFLAYFNRTLKQITGAAYSTQSLADHLARHPESLLRGKQ